MMAETNHTYCVTGGGLIRNSASRAAGNARQPRVPNNCDAIVRMPAAAEMAAEPTPIWLAVLIASRCQAIVNGAENAIRWNHVSGRALYTNAGPETETIEPLGVSLQQGHTVAVSWIPGETAYTVEVYRQYDLCA